MTTKFDSIKAHGPKKAFTIQMGCKQWVPLRVEIKLNTTSSLEGKIKQNIFLKEFELFWGRCHFYESKRSIAEVLFLNHF